MAFTEHEFGIALGYTPSGVDDGGGSFDPSYFYAQRQFSDDSTYTDGAINEIILMSSEVLDVANEYNAATSIFTAANAGVYEFHFQVTALNMLALLTGANTEGLLTVQLIHNTTAVAQVDGWSHTTTGSGDVVPTLSGYALVNMAAGDTIKLNIAGITGMDYNPSYAAGHTYLSGKRVA